MIHFAAIAVAIPVLGAVAIAVASSFRIDVLAGRAVAAGPVVAGLVVAGAGTFRRIASTASILTFAVVLFSTLVDFLLGPRGPEGMGGLFALLTAAAWLPAVFAARQCDRKRPALLYGLLLLLEAAFMGVFFTDHAVVFCLALESSTLVLALLISGWGGRESEPIARKFLIYNLAADMLVLIALLGLVVAAGRMSAESAAGSSQELTYSLSALTRQVSQLATDEIGGQEYWRHTRRWLLTALFLGLAIKTPLVPFHTWLPTVVAEGPLCASLVLLGAGMRVSAYAFMRFVQPLAGDLGAWGELLVAFVVLGALHESLLALAHGDLRRLTACASLSQASLAAAAFFSQQRPGEVGNVLLALGGGLASTLLLFVFGFLEMRFETRDLAFLGGLWRRLPQVSCVLLLAALSLVGIPGLSGFAGLFPTLGSLFAFQWFTALLAMGAVLIVGWSLFWMLERVVFAPNAASVESSGGDRAGDLRAVEVLVIAPLVAGIIVVGLRPQDVVDLIDASLRAGS